MPYVERRPGLKLHYTLDDFTDPWRNAPTLLLQHGNGRSGRFWYQWVPYLARFYRVVRPDLRGLGLTEGALQGGELTLEALLGDVDALLDTLGVTDVHFCGESMGGILGLAFAATRPARVRSLTLVSTPVFIEDGMKARYALGYGSRTDAMERMGIRAWVDATTRGTRLPAEERPGLFAWYVEEFAKGDPAIQIAMSRLVNQANAEAFLPDVRVPVLGLYPTEGQITSSRQETLLQQGLADFDLRRLPTPFHMVQLLYPATCAKEVLRFCARHDGLDIEEV